MDFWDDCWSVLLMCKISFSNFAINRVEHCLFARSLSATSG